MTIASSSTDLMSGSIDGIFMMASNKQLSPTLLIHPLTDKQLHALDDIFDIFGQFSMKTPHPDDIHDHALAKNVAVNKLAHLRVNESTPLWVVAVSHEPLVVVNKNNSTNTNADAYNNVQSQPTQLPTVPGHGPAPKTNPQPSPNVSYYKTTSHVL